MGRQWLNRMSLHLNSVWKVWTRASGGGPFLYDKKYGWLTKAVIVCILENVFFRLFLDGVRVMAFIGYGKRKSQWGRIKRVKQKGV